MVKINMLKGSSGRRGIFAASCPAQARYNRDCPQLAVVPDYRENAPLRVMLLVTDLERGGSPLRIARLACGMAARGMDVIAGCLAAAGPISAELDAAGVQTFACGATSARDWRLWPRLARLARDLRPDIVHSTLMHANVAARLTGRWTGVPVVTSTATIEIERRWHVWVERATARLDAGHIVNSQTLATHVVRVFHRTPQRVFVVPPSLRRLPRADRVAARRGLNLDDRDFVVLWIGRLDPVKGLDTLIRSAEILIGQPCRFLLAGDGAYRPAVERMLRVSGAAERVTLLGWREDVANLLSAADAFVCPSYTEGMPNAVLEAMAAGLPVVASDIPIMRELAGPEQRLLLAPRGDARALAEALVHVQADAALRAGLGGRAAAWARQYCDEQAVVSATLKVYEQVLASRNR